MGFFSKEDTGGDGYLDSPWLLSLRILDGFVGTPGVGSHQISTHQSNRAGNPSMALHQHTFSALAHPSNEVRSLLEVDVDGVV